MKEAIQSIRQLDRATYLLIAGFIVLNVLDGTLTRIGYGQGAYEINSVARHLLASESGVFWLYKIGLTLFAVAVLLFIATEYPKQVKWGFVGITGLFAGVCFYNVGVIL